MRFKEARVQSAAFRRFIPCKVESTSSTSSKLFDPSSGSSWRQEQMANVGAYAPPPGSRGQKCHPGKKRRQDLSEGSY